MIYTVAIPGVGDNISSHQYILRVTWPVEPFYKTASEVATLSYLREHTTIPVPGVIAHSSSAENELGCECGYLWRRFLESPFPVFGGT